MFKKILQAVSICVGTITLVAAFLWFNGWLLAITYGCLVLTCLLDEPFENFDEGSGIY